MNAYDRDPHARNRATRRRLARLERKRLAGGDRSGDEPAPQSPVLGALVASAMALPGLAGEATANGPVEDTTTSFSYYRYAEDDLRPSKASGGPNSTRERMEVDSWQFRLTTPLGERSDLEVDTSFETMSGASPWYVFQAAPDERPLQVMSQATIDDDRGDVLLKGNRYFDWGSASASTGFSIERDYYSVNFGLSGQRDFNDKNTTLTGGAGVSLDWVEPTSDRADPGRIDSDDKQSFNITAGLSQILTRHSIFQSTITYEYVTGFLSDPYKLVQVGVGVSANLERDSRPDVRNQFAWLNRYRHHFSAFNGTMHLDYRLYHDDWNVTSHTFDVAYYQTLPFGIELVPSARYYSQSQADFYEPVYSGPKSNGEYSSDYRLSPYGAFAYRLKAQWSFEDPWWNIAWATSLAYERYESKGSWALGSVGRENPGLVSFRVYSAGISARF